MHFPSFKSPLRYKSLSFYRGVDDFYIKLKGRIAMLTIPDIGYVRIKLYQDIEGSVKMLIIKRYAGNYYAILVVAKYVNVPDVNILAKPVGVDLGLKSFITLSDNIKVEKPKFAKMRAKRIKRLQNKIHKKKKDSTRRAKAIEQLERELAYSANQSLDFSQKLAHNLIAKGYTGFFVEKLNILGMVKNHSLAGAILNASWAKFIQILKYKAESNGIKVIKVSSKNTTRMCSKCKHMKVVGLGESVYRCDSCGLVIDRDLNAAINILNEGINLPRP